MSEISIFGWLISLWKDTKLISSTWWLNWCCYITALHKFVCIVIIKHKTLKLSFVSPFLQPQSDKCATAKICPKRLLYIVTFYCKSDTNKQKKSLWKQKQNSVHSEKNMCFFFFFFNFYFQKFKRDTRSWLYEGDGHDQQKCSRFFLKVGARSTPEGLMAQINYTYFRWKFINLTRQANLWVPLGVPELWMHKQLIRARWHICKLLTCTTSCCIWSRKTDIHGAARRRRVCPSPCEWWRREDWGGAKIRVYSQLRLQA